MQMNHGLGHVLRPVRTEIDVEVMICARGSVGILKVVDPVDRHRLIACGQDRRPGIYAVICPHRCRWKMAMQLLLDLHDLDVIRRSPSGRTDRRCGNGWNRKRIEIWRENDRTKSIGADRKVTLIGTARRNAVAFSFLRASAIVVTTCPGDARTGIRRADSTVALVGIARRVAGGHVGDVADTFAFAARTECRGWRKIN